MRSPMHVIWAVLQTDKNWDLSMQTLRISASVIILCY